MMETDSLDRRIVAALQIDARVPYGLLAQALGEVERTVARRVQRLVDADALRFTAFVDELRTGLGQTVSLRVEVDPGSADHVAEALALRADTRWVAVVTGDADVSCELLADGRAALHQVTSHELPSITGIRSTRSYPVLRHIKPTTAWHAEYLTPEEAEAVTAGAPAVPYPGAPVEMQPSDHRLIELLVENARYSWVELAERLGVVPATARRWTERLLGSGAVALRAEIEPELLGYGVEAELWLETVPSAIEPVAEALALHPAVRYCGVVAGTQAVNVLAVLPAMDDLFAFQVEVLGRLPGLVRCEATLVTRAHKRGFVAKR
ncbi:Lrp/AsnC family transcriptional regulator [Streptomyces sp. NBC_01433]|uniref:Lrp/AsnC family transcriptional regulator n=1 Tax=Streptomyces sp. NBC_01433 TaxID=2903864 RepID=UPI002255A6AE|nr:Lrp/AsnC family transcriptional regulator [Streptomyces sp. NBC_01433]MCX4679000.1 Lrp/AsnC family transcriptional regulator [Streptomyces sp. NBC_01433]